MDYYIGYALTESFKHLQPVWMAMFKKDKNFLADDAEKAGYLLKAVSAPHLLDMPGFMKDDPRWKSYTKAPLSSQDSQDLKDVTAVANFVNYQETNPAAGKAAPVSRTGRVMIQLTAVPAKMLFDKSTFTVPAGKQVSLVFKNSDDMAHNVVITRPGNMEKVGKAAEAMAMLKDGYEKNFVPKIPEVLFATPLVNGGKSFTLDFTAPARPGEYPFICSFPGHWQMMKGVMKVIKF
jgi:azurin